MMTTTTTATTELYPYPYTIFSVDNHEELYELKRAVKHLDELHARGLVDGKIIPCIGCYKGRLEPSFIMRTSSFLKEVRDKWFMRGQESYLQISDDKHMRARLLYNDGHTKELGRLIEVSSELAFRQDGWTYRPDLNTYWVATYKGDKT